MKNMQNMQNNCTIICKIICFICGKAAISHYRILTCLLAYHDFKFAYIAYVCTVTQALDFSEAANLIRVSIDKKIRSGSCETRRCDLGQGWAISCPIEPSSFSVSDFFGFHLHLRLTLINQSYNLHQPIVPRYGFSVKIVEMNQFSSTLKSCYV